jgi:soluble lytic murein transglycosylase-like protein
VWRPVLGAPRADSSRAVVWSGAPDTLSDAARALAERLARGDSLAAWTWAASQPRLAPVGLRRAAAMSLARGDTLGADTLLARLASLGSPWDWEAVRQRADLALARGEAARAEAVLADADRTSWPDAERAAWLLRRARTRVPLGDTAQAIDLARQLVLRYPALPPAAQGVSLLETQLATRGESLTSADQEACAEVDAFRSDRDSAARRLREALGGAPSERRWRIELRLAEILRALRRTDPGLEQARAAARHAPDARTRAACTLERARLLRDADRTSEAFKAYDAANAADADLAVRESAMWEKALELEDLKQRARARAAYLEVVRLGGRRRSDAALRAGLLSFADGRLAQALETWRTEEGEGIEFWRAVIQRGTARDDADQALADIARRPGFTFYRTAARETLGVRGWSGNVTPPACGSDSACATLGLVRDLLGLGATDEAMLILQRWSADRSADADRGSVTTARALLEGARLAYAAGKTPVGIRLAQRAFDACARADSEVAWGAAVWAYPPAFDSLYVPWPESWAHDSLDRSLLRAIAWQESRFDPNARSRSDALGLYQMKRSTASDVARWLREPAPSESTLMDPGLSLRYGVAYVRWLLTRTDGRVEGALAAYNAGPNALPEHAAEMRAKGGAALYAEMLGKYETRDYVKRILATRQAYRELTPRVRP